MVTSSTATSVVSTASATPIYHSGNPAPISVVDRLNGIAVGGFDSYYPTINGRRIKSAKKMDMGFDPTFDRFTYEVATRHFIKITAESSSSNLKFCWFAEKQPANQFYTAYPCLPQDDFTLSKALPKFCTLFDKHPSFQMLSAAFNRTGVGIFGFDTLSKQHFFCWGSPSDCVVDIVQDSNPKVKNGHKTASTSDGSLSYLDTNKDCFLNGEKAERIDLDKIFRDLPELKKMKAELLSRRQQLTKETGIEVNADNLPVSVLLHDSRSNLLGRKTYEVKILDKWLVTPNMPITSGIFDGRIHFERSVRMTFESLPNHIVQVTENDLATTTVLFVDMHDVVDDVAFRIFESNPRPGNAKSFSLKAVDTQITSSNLSSFEVAVVNEHGTIVIVKKEKERTFHYGINFGNLKVNEELAKTIFELGDLLTARAYNTLQVDIEHISKRSLTIASINLNPAFVIRPEVLTFRRGVQKHIDALEREHNQIMPPDIWENVHDYAMWNEFSD